MSNVYIIHANDAESKMAAGVAHTAMFMGLDAHKLTISHHAPFLLSSLLPAIPRLVSHDHVIMIGNCGSVLRQLTAIYDANVEYTFIYKDGDSDETALFRLPGAGGWVNYFKITQGESLVYETFNRLMSKVNIGVVPWVVSVWRDNTPENICIRDGIEVLHGGQRDWSHLISLASSLNDKYYYAGKAMSIQRSQWVDRLCHHQGEDRSFGAVHVRCVPVPLPLADMVLDTLLQSVGMAAVYHDVLDPATDSLTRHVTIRAQSHEVAVGLTKFVLPPDATNAVYAQDSITFTEPVIRPRTWLTRGCDLVMNYLMLKSYKTQ